MITGIAHDYRTSERVCGQMGVIIQELDRG